MESALLPSRCRALTHIMLNQQLSESQLSPLTPVETEGGRRGERKVTGMDYTSVHTHTDRHTDTHIVDLSNLECEILRQSTVEDKTLYVWTSVSWGPESNGRGKWFLSSLIPPHFLVLL